MIEPPEGNTTDLSDSYKNPGIPKETPTLMRPKGSLPLVRKTREWDATSSGQYQTLPVIRHPDGRIAPSHWYQNWKAPCNSCSIPVQHPDSEGGQNTRDPGVQQEVQGKDQEEPS